MISRNTMLGLTVLAIWLGAATSAEAAVLFNNFSAGDTYGTTNGWTLGELPIVPNAQNIEVGMSFTPPAGDDYLFDQAALVVSLAPSNQGDNELDVFLRSDDGGLPGVVLESFHFTGAMGPLGSNNPLIVADSILNPTLTGGTQYWLTAGSPTAIGAWNFNTSGDLGFIALKASIGGTDFGWGQAGNADSKRGVFRISGSVSDGAAVIPEPTTLLLFGSGLLGAYVVRRKTAKKFHDF